MRHQITKDLFAYWRRLKGARLAPDRSDIDPSEIRQILADTFIIEVDPAGVYPLRLSGTRLNALWLCDRKGASFIDLWRDEDRPNISAALQTVIDGVAPVVAGARTVVRGSPPLELEALLLPLRHFGKTHSRVLGALAPVYQPEWLGLRRAGPLELVSLRVVDPAALRLTTYKEGRFDGAQTSRQRPRLVVYEGGKHR